MEFSVLATPRSLQVAGQPQLLAAFHMTDGLEEEGLVEHFSDIQALVLEGSTDTFQKVEEDTKEKRMQVTGKLVGCFGIPR